MAKNRKVFRREDRKINNPFPRRPKGLGFIKGNLFINFLDLPPHPQAFDIGKDFSLKWIPQDGGFLSVFHRLEPRRSLWSTVPGMAFISAAMSRHLVQESRGSIAIDDNVTTICCHQTVEDIRVLYPQETLSEIVQPPENDIMGTIPKGTQCGNGANKILSNSTQCGDHPVDPIVVLTGCLYNTSKVAREQFDEFLQQGNHLGGPFYTSKCKEEGCCPRFLKIEAVGVRYYLSFGQNKEYDLRFTVRLEEPKLQTNKNPSLLNLESYQPKKTGLAKIGIMHNCADARYCSHSRSKPDVVNGTAIKKRGFPLLKRVRCQFAKLHNFECTDSQKLLSNKKIKHRPAFNRIALTFSSERDEKFYGFGEQFSYMDMRGKRVPILVQEQGIGRGDQPVTAAANLVAYRSGGNWSTTYAPSPFYMTSKMKCLYLEGYDYSVFDLTMDDRVQVQVYGESMQGRILHGCSPIQLLERYTETIGRMPELPKWIHSGAIVGMQGGTEFVRHVWGQLQKYDVPISAFWLQDWVGQRRTSIGSQLWWNWEVDSSYYPGWRQLVQDLQSSGIQMMTYCNPCIVPTDKKPNRKRNFFEEANKLGLLVKNKSGSTYMIPNTTFDVGMLDLTNPAARTWFKDILKDMVDTGVRGWMADFGEGLPLDACLFSGEHPISAHNRYPQLWAEINREFVEEHKAKQSVKEGTEQELVFFMRAGFREIPRWATLFWEGDQMVSWQRNDGIKSAIVGLLSSGLSGYALNHSDIGGYCAIDLPFSPYKRSEELLLRWMELNSFTTIFRTHEGNSPSANKQFYSNDRTLSHFARFAKVYKAWEFYRIQLVKEAATRGIPVARHLFLHYPGDEYVQKLTYEQFLVGSEMLVVPVVDKGRKTVKAYFPVGDESWQHIWTGRLIHGMGIETWIDAPLGYPAVFVKAGSPVGTTFLQNLVALGIK